MNNSKKKYFILETKKSLFKIPDFDKSAMDSNLKKYLIGRNEQSLEFHSKYKTNGIIDDFYTHNQWRDIPVLKSNEVTKNSIVFNLSSSISPVNVNNFLKQIGIKKIINLSDIVSTSAELIEKPWFNSQQENELLENINYWATLYTKLEDSISSKTLLDVVRFRLTANISYMQDYAVKIEDQYMEDFLELKKEFFVDAGGFNGDSTQNFIKICPDYQKIYFFEPCPINFKLAKTNLVKEKNIIFKRFALSDRFDKLRFISDRGSASSVQHNGLQTVKSCQLDHILKGKKVSYIKMDIEGLEYKALIGSSNIIKNYKPKLAIAVYHHAEDFRRIPEFLLKINPDYKVYLRHYTQGWSETIMYFI